MKAAKLASWNFSAYFLPQSLWCSRDFKSIPDVLRSSSSLANPSVSHWCLASPVFLNSGAFSHCIRRPSTLPVSAVQLAQLSGNALPGSVLRLLICLPNDEKTLLPCASEAMQKPWP
jgi:hypothetical protein